MEKKECGVRLMSLDAFRGFDMMFIMGLYGLVLGVAGLFGLSDKNTDWIPAVFHHVPWEGFHFIDSVFPTFLFIAGVSFPFSLAKSRERGLPDSRIWLRTLKRGILLTLLGVVYNGGLTSGVEQFRFASVLQRIGVGWMFAGFIYLAVRDWRVRFGIFLLILFGWWALVQFVPAPGCPAGIDWMMTPVSTGADGKPTLDACYNLVVWVDRHLPGLLGNRVWPIEPEGLLSHVGGIATAMIGMFAGEFVMRSRKAGETGPGPCVRMWIASALLLALGWVFIALGTPCIKAIWSASFVCCVGAYSLAMFTLFYWLIDVKGWRRWTTFFRVIGMNSITIYLGQCVFRTWDAAHGPIGFFIGSTGESAEACGLCGALGPVYGGLVWGGVYFFGLWAALYYLYRKQIFLKV